MWRLLLFVLIGTAAAQPDTKVAASSCVRCHLELEEELQQPAKLSSEDIHFQKGLSCHNCHGGDPTIGVETGGPEDSMSRAKGYIGVPKRGKIAGLCASCHNNLDTMRRYNPQARVDQYSEYVTSVHGKQYLKGDSNVATCTDCHSAHGVRSVSNPTSPVYATNVADTCARCHADAKRMAAYKIPANQRELYGKSVHGEALIKNRDLSAPTCNDCHGNHGATPPGVDSVANVCGQCHATQWDLFNKSPHKKAFAENQLPACVTCHEHHGILRTSDNMLGVEASANCVTCHERGSAGYAAAEAMKRGITRLQTRLDAATELLHRAERAGMEVSRPIYDLSEAKNHLVLARVEIHGFDLAALDKTLAEGEKITLASEQSGWKAMSDLAYRRKGLAVSVVILLAMIGLLVAKIRQIESAKAKGSGG